ncbi:MAG: hypothetical protein GY730_07595, partial [bacterium]|nr:hypothetical protein [bacterium]
MKKLKYLRLFLFICLVDFFPVISDGSEIDFGWSVPEYFSDDKGTEDEKRFLIWAFSIKNTVDKAIPVSVSTMLLTDTDKYYE